MRIVCLSDTHDRHDELDVPDGDVLVHGGDFTMVGDPHEIEAFAGFLARLPHRHKIVIAGNHDFLFQNDGETARALLGDAIYLEDSGVEVEGVRFWGSPWQPWFGNWAFNLHRGDPIAEKWRLVPAATDVLVTHGPPWGILDRTARGEPVGCEALEDALRRIRPKLHVFGHIHESYGTHRTDATLSVNACNCNLRYEAVNPPVVVDWDAEGPRLLT